MISPCKTCENRGCGSYHDECEKYKEYRVAKDEECNDRTAKFLVEEDVRARIKSMGKRRNSNGIWRCHKK